MKVLIIGGSGKVGKCAAERMVEADCVSRVTVADINFEGAKGVARKLGQGAEARHLDVNNRAEMVKAFGKVDLVMNMIGPGSLYAVPIAKAALEARKDYIDINDDAGPVDELLRLNKAAQEAEITMVSGLGGSPGLTNLWARYSADELDQVDEIKICWAAGLHVGNSTPANWRHRLDLYGGNVPIFDGGTAREVRAGSEPEEVTWPPPVGKVRHRVCGHPEAKSIPHYIGKGLKRVVCKGAVHPSELNEFLVSLGSMGGERRQNIKVDSGAVSPFQFFSYFMCSDVFKDSEFYKRIIEKEARTGSKVQLRVETEGVKEGKRTRVVCTLFGSERNVTTAISPCVVGEMILRGDIELKGLVYPEALGLDPQPIMHEINNSGGISSMELLQ